MWDLAKQFKAAVVFAEHRFYGMTMPFRDAWTEATRSVDGIDKLSTMDVRQVIEDYAYAIPQLKSALKLPPNTPVIAFGGSYGGMLTGWLALKHPNLLAGAWAASAPLIFFKGSGIDVGAYYAITKRTLLAAGCDEVAILQGFNAIGRLGQSVLGRKILEKAFNVDTTTSPLKTAYDAEGLEGWVREALEYMTMTDYPYPSNFLKPLPGWPVNEACKFLKSAPANLSDYVTLASQIANASFVYYGNDKKHCVVGGCGDDATSGLDGGRVSDPKAYLAWTYQACTQMTIYSCAQGPPNDLFWTDCDADQFTREMEEGCGYWLGEIKGYVGNDRFFKTYFVRDEYGYNLDNLRNVIFTNGKLDPWSGGGITSAHLAANAKANGVYVYNIDGAAHHLDLREPNTCDPEPVKAARYQMVGILKCWLSLRPAAECADATKLQWDLPPFSQKESVNCRPDTYPWGQKGHD
ncbi:PCP-1.1 protein [Aphelenchoides avenae]|nr:PCP-1.1 protein [Aphelenchus avenae]